jgi:hypothetical protein
LASSLARRASSFNFSFSCSLSYETSDRWPCPSSQEDRPESEMEGKGQGSQLQPPCVNLPAEVTALKLYLGDSKGKLISSTVIKTWCI